ncbi:heterokaryon incompatibility protein-domain-containing protein [Diaporthe sp. PMI_573]|nr:heterokaryon incompatibility protein-domain-containing protein [Diaporthaceae sp. PMI_573]
MATLPESLIFQHNPLQDAKTHIRLLKVVSVVKSRAIPVHCELGTFPIAEAPPYRAISYTWGDPAPLTSILVNEQQMDVRLNCEYALRQASQDDDATGDSFIWIDSICVNQHDNDEKGAQVAMMGEIFKTASRVLACAGAHRDDSEFLYEFLRGEKDRFRSLLLSEAYLSWEGSRLRRSKLIRRHRAAWRWKHPRTLLIRLCQAVADFLARPYFHRVWIYQELFLGRDMSVYCGDEKLPISWLWVTSSIIQSWLLNSTDYLLFLKAGMWTALWPKINEAMPLLLAGAREQPPMPFLEATSDVATLLCEDPRDSVYGILSITRTVGGHQFQPDYAKDRMDLAVEVLRNTRAEIMSHSSDFSRLTEFAQTVGLNLKLKDKPSRKLVAAMELRRSYTETPQNEGLNAVDTRVEKNGKDIWPFLGCQILCQQEGWVFPNQHKWFRRYGLPFQPPKMTKCLQDDTLSDALADIHLPAQAQDGDWLLIPHSYHWLLRTYSQSRIAFLARKYDSEKFEIVGKVLISKWVSKWGKTFEKRASNFKFYCDHEDLLVLFDLCKWNNLWWVRKWEDSESVDAYFQTRFCGQRFSSYAVRTET